MVPWCNKYFFKLNDFLAVLINYNLASRRNINNLPNADDTMLIAANASFCKKSQEW